MNYIDAFLNKITMYRLVLYVLVFLVLVAVILSMFAFLPYNPVYILISTFFILTVGIIFHSIFSRVFDVPANIESVYITALILALIITPMKSFVDFDFISLAFWATSISMASKFIFAINKKHIFNPAAFGVAITALFLNLSASWWIATVSLFPFVLICGLLIVRKISRSDLVWSFIISAILIILFSSIGHITSFFDFLKKIFIDTPILFFAFIMLTEPLTTPPTKYLRIAYGAITALLYAPFIHIGSIYSTPELALVLGNIFSFAVSPKYKLLLKLKEKKQLTKNIYEFIFSSETKMKFKPGQYLEWTLPMEKSDSRGNRRYFTISSSPTENNIHVGVKFNDNGSEYKKTLQSLAIGDAIVAAGLSGEFILPKNKNKKLVFIAGGIGVTPFRSMIKYLIDTNEKRNIILLYSNYRHEDIVYKELFDMAKNAFGMKTFYFVTDENNGDGNFIHERISAENIKKLIPDFAERYFYISGSNAMVKGVAASLKEIGIAKNHVKNDYFPGF